MYLYNMYCGAAMKETTNATAKDIKDILSKIDDNIPIVINGSSHFYIHFDKECVSINFDNRPRYDKYGIDEEKKCTGCPRYNTEKKKCGCTGDGCVNFESYFKSILLDNSNNKKLVDSLNMIKLSYFYKSDVGIFAVPKDYEHRVDAITLENYIKMTTEKIVADIMINEAKKKEEENKKCFLTRIFKRKK